MSYISHIGYSQLGTIKRGHEKSKDVEDAKERLAYEIEPFAATLTGLLLEIQDRFNSEDEIPIGTNRYGYMGTLRKKSVSVWNEDKEIYEATSVHDYVRKILSGKQEESFMNAKRILGMLYRFEKNGVGPTGKYLLAD